MPYKVVADSFHTKKLCSRLLKQSVNLDGKRPFCIFEPPPPFVGSGATYDDHLRLHGKCVVDFLLVLIEHF